MMASSLVARKIFFLLALAVCSILPVTLARQLRAVAPVASVLNARAYNLRPTFVEHELAYLDPQYESILDSISAPGDADQFNKQHQFGASVRFSPKKYRLLHLDRASEHFSHIFCSASCSISKSPLSTMEMHFDTRMQVIAAREAWQDAYPFAMIISDAACAEGDGSAHQHFLVSEVHFYPDEFIATMLVERTSFQATADTVHVEFGKRQTEYLHVASSTSAAKDRKYRKPSPFRKECGSRWAAETREKQEFRTTSLSAEYTPTSTEAARRHKRFDFGLSGQQSLSSATFSQTIIYSTPTGQPTATARVKNLSLTFTNTSLLPPDPNIRVQIPDVSVPVDVTLSCTECTTTGFLELEEGAITMKASDNEFESFMDFANSGFVKVAARGVAASMGLELIVSPSFTQESFVAYLPTVAIPGLSIPGVGAIGPIFQPQIVMTLAMDTGLEFTSGFDLFVPDSEIMLNISHPENSTISGFENSIVSPHALGVEVIPPALTFSLAFVPQIQLGFVAEDGSVSGGAGVFLHLPEYNATLSRVQDVFQNCSAAPPQAQNISTDVVFREAFPLTKSIVLDVGVESNLRIAGSGVKVSDTLASKVYPLSSDCLAFDPKSHSLQNATNPIFRSSQKPPNPSPSLKKSGATRLRRQPALTTLVLCLVVWTNV